MRTPIGADLAGVVGSQSRGLQTKNKTNEEGSDFHVHLSFVNKNKHDEIDDDECPFMDIKIQA